MASTTIDTEAPPTRFLRKLDWSAFWTTFLISFIGYFLTLAPTVTLEDSGELAVAGDCLGVPHPPGYPIWTMLVWVFTKVFAFVHFRGQPNPAWSIGLASAVFGALAAGISAMLVCRSGTDLLRVARDTAQKPRHATEDWICWMGGVVSSLLFAFTPVMWSQTVIVEVYALNSFFLTIVLLLSYWWMVQPSNRLLYVTAFIFGLGLTNYQVLLLAAIPLAIVIFLKNIGLFRDFLVVAIPLALLFVVWRGGILEGISHPTDFSDWASFTHTMYFYALVNFLILGLGFAFLPNGKTVAITILLAELGICFYAYMPLVSDLRKPLPMNWGYPRTWEGFKHAVTRGQYEKIEVTNVFSMQFIHQIGFYFSDLRIQYTLLAMPLGFLPFTVWRVLIGKQRVTALHAAVILGVPAVILGELHKYLGPGNALLEFAYKSLLLGVLALAALGLAIMGISQAVGVWKRFFGSPASSGTAGPSIPASEPPVRVIVDDLSQQWMLSTMVAFLMMSVALIALCNPKCDIQDNFIQKVKFIMSHELYALWIGYGIIFGLAFTDTFFRDNRAVIRLSLLGTALLPLIPIHRNLSDKELIRVYGGAEQNGYDFGWQFGNYQLRGAEAISEELSPDEEPLPNPEYPPEMGPDAVFFGGTDPGRFVPTYMIYGADVRPDVFLITQNALADNTYMSVMRDLYGDAIWIPAVEDSAKAFARYVDEVQSGKRPRNADLKIENGRVQVSGALGVMEINGILAQMIFERNIWKHSFYVEESYVIPWMYEYLLPHGLIMKIGHDLVVPPRAAAGAEAEPDIAYIARTYYAKQRDAVRDDMDFWDWYTRRLIDNPAFVRDIVARKSFSKLRSALGGLYANRGLYRFAEEAFQESRILYPLSPEANFRLVQEVYMPYRRFNEARQVIAWFGTQDPGNEKVKPFLGQMDDYRTLFERIGKLEKDYQTRPGDANTVFELAQLYWKAQQRRLFKDMADVLLASTNLPGQYYYGLTGMLQAGGYLDELGRALDLCMARLPPNVKPDIYLDLAARYSAAGRLDRMEQTLVEYVRLTPTDWKAWLDLGVVQLELKKLKAAVTSLQQAVRYSNGEALQTIESDPRFAPVRKQVLLPTPQRNLLGIPGVTPER